MRIKKFNESTSRQIEWLDGDIFKLEDLTGKVTSFSKDRYFIHFENGAIGTELFYHQGQIDHCLNKEFKLIKSTDRRLLSVTCNSECNLRSISTFFSRVVIVVFNIYTSNFFWK